MPRITVKSSEALARRTKRALVEQLKVLQTRKVQRLESDSDITHVKRQEALITGLLEDQFLVDQLSEKLFTELQRKLDAMEQCAEDNES